MTESERFKEIIEKVKNQEMTKDEGLAALKQIDYSKFNMVEIKNSTSLLHEDWIPKDFSVGVLKGWMRMQDQVLLQIRSFLFLKPTISKEQLTGYAVGIKSPSSHNENELVVQNIIEKIGNAGESREYINPFDQGLIYAEASNASTDQAHHISKLFTLDNTYFSSAPLQNTSFTVALPPFLTAKLTSYTLWGPPRMNQKAQGGPSSWILYGSNDNITFHKIDDQTSNQDLNKEDACATFQVSTNSYYRFFKFVISGVSHLNNWSIHLKRFDISGILLIANNK
ncbi:hypothetical protein GPJ56_001606 [Histomonas meleagridis]|uniref:uncharacterized protein n=1 Tax=Histomonas meleagridis TaxID=135588 RepID=UPI00355A4258|nr:hypothetical protein GPJ56_001606 [Histomonas meleagridis]KAH0807112.1 hypothetical protein GO595_000288 [Histomonas meleagridis]